MLRKHLVPILVLGAVLSVAPMSAGAEDPLGPSLHGGPGLWLEDAPAFGLGLGVSPLRTGLLPRAPLGAAPAGSTSYTGLAPYKLTDTDLQTGLISVDLRLRTPAWTIADTSVLQPYVTVGPTLFVSDGSDVHDPLGPTDVSMSMGVKAGAGVALQLSPKVSLFGEFRFMHSGQQPVMPLGGRAGVEKDLSGRDFLYGFSLRF